MDKMKVRKANKKDVKEYTKLVKKSNQEYQKIVGKKIKFTEKQIKKDFNEFTKSKNKMILLANGEDKLAGYLAASIFINSYRKIGYIDNIFIDDNHRKKGIATKLFDEFVKILRKRKIRKIKLGVNIRNKRAIGFWKNLGFKTYHYDMEKELK